MPEVRVGPGSEYLLLTPSSPESPPATLTVHLALDGLTAGKVIVGNYAGGFSDLADFFSGLAASWRGWEGSRRWQSLEGDLALDARYEYGHAHVTVMLRHEGEGWGRGGWEARGDLVIDPGEQMSAIAAQVEALARG